MPSFRTVTRMTTVALIVSAAACGDTITQGNSPPQRVDEAMNLASSGDTTPPPTLEVTSSIATTSGFTGTGRPGLFLRIETVGSGFPPGVIRVQKVAFVLNEGGVVTPGTGIGPVPADGTIAGSYGQSCPTPYREAYAVVSYNGKTVESKHIAPAC